MPKVPNRRHCHHLSLSDNFKDSFISGYISFFLFVVLLPLLDFFIFYLLLLHPLLHNSVLARISKGQGATSEKGTFMRKRWLKKGTLMHKD